jgi:hypothetical protein
VAAGEGTNVSERNKTEDLSVRPVQTGLPSVLTHRGNGTLEKSCPDTTSGYPNRKYFLVSLEVLSGHNF